MHERAWVKDFFGRWKKKARPIGSDSAFYTALRKFDVEMLSLPGFVLSDLDPEDETDQALLELWRIWNKAVKGNFKTGIAETSAVAKTHKYRPEPFIMWGALALLSGDRKTSHSALVRAIRVDPKDEQVRLLISRLGIRRPPVLSFLERSNPINIALGKVRSRLSR